MADITLSYKGSTIATMSASGSKTIQTAGKYCEADIGLVYEKPENTLPPLPSAYQEVEYIETGEDQGYAYIRGFNIPAKTYVYLDADGSGQIFGNEQSLNLSIITADKYFVTYGNYIEIFKSWDLITGSNRATFGLYFTSSYTNMNLGLWRANQYTYSGKIYKMYGLNLVKALALSTTPESIVLTSHGDAHWTGSQWVFCLVPCYRKADNAAGFYDTVNDVFYTARQGTFSVGPDVT